MSYTMVRDEFAEIDRLNAQFDNIVKRHCKIGKVTVKRRTWAHRTYPPIFTQPTPIPPWLQTLPIGTPDFIHNPVISISTSDARALS